MCQVQITEPATQTSLQVMLHEASCVCMCMCAGRLRGMTVCSRAWTHKHTHHAHTHTHSDTFGHSLAILSTKQGFCWRWTDTRACHPLTPDIPCPSCAVCPPPPQISAATCRNSALPYVSVGCAGDFCDSLLRCAGPRVSRTHNPNHHRALTRSTVVSSCTPQQAAYVPHGPPSSSWLHSAAPHVCHLPLMWHAQLLTI